GVLLPASRNSVRKADRGGSSKVSSKPDCVSPEPTSTFTELSASTASGGAGTRTIRADNRGNSKAPCIFIRHPTCRRERDVEAPPERVGQLVGIDHRVGVGDAPVQQWVVEIFRPE